MGFDFKKKRKRKKSKDKKEKKKKQRKEINLPYQYNILQIHSYENQAHLTHWKCIYEPKNALNMPLFLGKSAFYNCELH